MGKTSESADEDRESKYFINALDRAIDVLEAFPAHGSELSLGQVAHATGLSKTTAYRILITLKLRGLIVKNQEANTYRLGISTVILAESAKATIGVIPKAKPLMRLLRDQLGHSVFLSVRNGFERIDIEQAEGYRKGKCAVETGVPRSLMEGAPGHVLASGLTEVELKDVFRLERKQKADCVHFLRSLANVQSMGYAWDVTDGSLVISAPVKAGSAVTAALSVVVPENYSTKRIQVAGSILEATRQLQLESYWNV